MKKNLFFLSLLIAIAHLNAMDQKGTPAAAAATNNRKKTFDAELNELISEMDKTEEAVSRLRVKTVGMQQLIRASIPGFAQFELLGNVPTKMDPASKNIKYQAVMAQLEEQNLTDAQKTLYRDTVLQLFELGNEEGILTQTIKEMEAIADAVSKKQIANSCDLL